MFEEFETLQNESMKNHTTLRIGGNARWFLLPKNSDELEKIINICKQNSISCFILGNGSNLLVSDEGYNGVIISMKKFDKIEIVGRQEIKVFAGVNLFGLNSFCAENEFSGLEWSYGIPGTVGGACFMNAGAYDDCFCSKIKQITVLKNGKLSTRKKIHFGYRKGCLKKGEVLVSAILSLLKGKKDKILEKQRNYLKLRKEKQPFDFPSLGSVFKRDEKYIPAYLIDKYGLKGTSKGDICVSKKHAGFLINKKNGRAKDFLDIVNLIENLAKKDGYIFQREFVMLGFDK